MRKTFTLLLVILGATTIAAESAAAKRAYQKVKGEVIKVEQHVRTENGGEYDRLTIRTRQGEEMQLHLGEGGACEGCFQEGDRVRARLLAGAGPEAECRIQHMKVRRAGEMFILHQQDGHMVRVHDGAGRAAGRQGRSQTGRGGHGHGEGRGGQRHRG